MERADASRVEAVGLHEVDDLLRDRVAAERSRRPPCVPTPQRRALERGRLSKVVSCTVRARARLDEQLHRLRLARLGGEQQGVAVLRVERVDEVVGDAERLRLPAAARQRLRRARLGRHARAVAGDVVSLLRDSAAPPGSPRARALELASPGSSRQSSISWVTPVSCSPAFRTLATSLSGTRRLRDASPRPTCPPPKIRSSARVPRRCARGTTGRAARILFSSAKHSACFVQRGEGIAVVPCSSAANAFNPSMASSFATILTSPCAAASRSRAPPPPSLTRQRQRMTIRALLSSARGTAAGKSPSPSFALVDASTTSAAR